VINLLFVTLLAAASWIVLSWAFHHLPGEEWQFLASVPRRRLEGGLWNGLNLTYYGVLSATAYTVGVTLFFVLMGSIGVSFAGSCGVILLLLGVCMPASQWVARIVEKKRHTFTVGGASFVGMLLAPWVVFLFDTILPVLWGEAMPVLPTLAGLSVAYAMGEGMGRLACISFGCCYGQSLAASHPFWGKVFGKWNFIFTGHTKKIAYAGGLDGQKVIPIQAVTAVCYISVGLISTLLFLNSLYGPAFLTAVTVTQAWRVASELLRADYRGDQPISVYQIMAVLSTGYSALVYEVLPISAIRAPDILLGLGSLWDPAVLLLLQSLWAAAFLYTGRSKVTGSTLSFHFLTEKD
jgi:hypothetical protein